MRGGRYLAAHLLEKIGGIMKTSSKILLVISLVGLLAFLVKSIVDKANFSAYHVTFDFNLTVNALLFLFPAALLAAIALFLERKTRVLAICATFFAAFCVEELTRHIAVEHFTAADGLLMAIPYIASAVIFAIFAIISKMRGK